MHILKGLQENLDKGVKVNHTVDEETVVIGRGTEKVSKAETQRMLEETLDTSSGEERAVYDKVWKGVKKT